MVNQNQNPAKTPGLGVCPGSRSLGPSPVAGGNSAVLAVLAVFDASLSSDDSAAVNASDPQARPERR